MYGTLAAAVRIRPRTNAPLAASMQRRKQMAAEGKGREMRHRPAYRPISCGAMARLITMGTLTAMQLSADERLYGCEQNK